ncbi:MAG: GTP 3',8-cyclase MoaA [Calditrichaeota bacterium]|nr:MAG: GTP 3',8-cyclase MoaA [Calditrichota bacterium]
MPPLTWQPFTDAYGRTITYARIALTDRCNLRCTYCMPEAGPPFIPRDKLLSYEQWYRLLAILTRHGVSKIRVTGGEPFVRKGSLDFITSLKSRFPEIRALHITSNGVGLAPHLNALKENGVDGLNISLDSLNPGRFYKITRRDPFHVVYDTIEKALQTGFRLKINMVVMRGVNDDELEAFCLLARNKPLDVRFIEQMPFNGHGDNATFLSARVMEERLRRFMPDMHAAPGSATARMFTVPGFQGRVGIIAAYSRTFCGQCNRIRITPVGGVQTCLYAPSALNIRDMLEHADDTEVVKALRAIIGAKARDGFEAEEANRFPLASMAQIGG